MQEKIKNYATLRRLLATGFFVSGIIPILIIAAGSIYNFKELSLKNIENTARQVVEHRNDVLNTFLQGQVNFLSTLINLYPLDYLQNKDNLKALFLAISREGKEGEIVDLQLIDTAGTQLAYVGPYKEKVEGKRYKDSPWFNQVLVRGTHVSDVFTGYRDYPHFVIALTDPMKTYVLRATINSSIFNSLLYSAQIGPSGDAFILNSNGEFQTPSLQRATSLNPTEIKMLKHHPDTEVLTDATHLYASKWLNGNMWLLVVKTRITDNLEVFYNYRTRIIFSVLFISAMFLLFSIGISRLIVARLERTDREQNALDQQMAHIEKMANIGRLAAGIAHEINNPVAILRNYLRILDRKSGRGEPIGEELAILDSEMERIGRITLDLEQLALAQVIARPDRSELHPRLKDILRMFRGALPEDNSITLAFQPWPEPLNVRADGDRLRQILLNLLANALDAVSGGGTITVRTEPGPDTVRVLVEDTGPGIDPALQAGLFEDGVSGKEGRHGGFGLAIVRSLAEQMGGAVSCGSQSGRTVFTLVLPS